jgi:hypothetical protein
VRPYLEREFQSLVRTWPASSPERQSFDRDVERILTFIDEKVDAAANGVAVFACSIWRASMTPNLDMPCW